MGVFKRMYSRQLQDKFEALAKEYPTLKFVEYKDVDGFWKSHIQGNQHWESLFDDLNGTIVVVRKEELVRRSVKAMEVYDPAKHDSLKAFVEKSYLIDIDIFTPLNY